MQGNSSICVEANPKSLVADAHWTSQKHLALKIVTADCMPVFIYHPMSQKILGLHAGWKGLLNGILENSISNVFDDFHNLKVWIGPHIQQPSFEVGSDVFFAAQKYSNIFNTNECFTSLNNNDKYLFSMSKFAKNLLFFRGVRPKNLFVSNTNTFFSNGHFSYRRNNSEHRRQISFIVLNK